MAATTHEDLERQIKDIQSQKRSLETKGDGERIGFTSKGHFDRDIYGASDDKFSRYVTSIATNEAEEDDEDEYVPVAPAQQRTTFTAPKAVLDELPPGEDIDPFADTRARRIADRENEYQSRRRLAIISPARADPFADGEL
jgi:splicing factor 3B subunit 1